MRAAGQTEVLTSHHTHHLTKVEGSLPFFLGFCALDTHYPEGHLRTLVARDKSLWLAVAGGGEKMDGLRFYNYFLKVTNKVPKQKHGGK